MLALQLNTPINVPGNWLPMVMVESVKEVVVVMEEVVIVWVVVSSILLVGVGETVGGGVSV